MFNNVNRKLCLSAAQIVLMAIFCAALAGRSSAITQEMLVSSAKSFMAVHLAKDTAESLDKNVFYGATAFKAYVDGVVDACPFQFNFPEWVTMQEIAEIAALYVLYSDRFDDSVPPAATIMLALAEKYGIESDLGAERQMSQSDIGAAFGDPARREAVLFRALQDLRNACVISQEEYVLRASELQQRMRAAAGKRFRLVR